MKFSFNFFFFQKKVKAFSFQTPKLNVPALICSSCLFFDEITQKFVCVQIKANFLWNDLEKALVLKILSKCGIALAPTILHVHNLLYGTRKRIEFFYDFLWHWSLKNVKFRQMWNDEITNMLQGEEQKKQLCWKNMTETEAARGQTDVCEGEWHWNAWNSASPAQDAATAAGTCWWLMMIGHGLEHSISVFTSTCRHPGSKSWPCFWGAKRKILCLPKKMPLSVR